MTSGVITTGSPRPTALIPLGTTAPFYFEFMDERKRKIAEIVMDYVVIFGISVLGIVTNSLVIIVYAK